MPACLPASLRHVGASEKSWHFPVFRPSQLSCGAVVALLAAFGATRSDGQTAAPPAASAPVAKDDAAPAVERLTKLVTSDGVSLAAWFYPAAKPETTAGKPADAGASDGPAPVVILVHDLGGSHASLEPLARDLQARGIAVVAPDLRGHGETKGPADRDDLDAKTIKLPDFVKMTMTDGGRVREQAENRGDLETVRNWIRENAAARRLDVDRLVVVGSGVGAAIAAQWTMLDAAWPDIASGPQGRQVRGLVFVSPVWTTRGFTIGSALAGEPVRRSVPVLVIGGTGDADGVKIYDQLKRQRPDAWNEKRAGQAAPTQSPKAAGKSPITLYLRQFDSPLKGDELAAYVPAGGRGGHPAAIIDGFVNAITAGAP